jgi:stage 0 sporulation regulatory protein
MVMVSEIEKLEDRINHLREELIQIAKAAGLNSNETLRHSQKLDDLITRYQKSKNKQFKKFD